MSASGTESHVLVFQDKRHNLKMLLEASRAAPSVGIPVAELAPVDDARFSDDFKVTLENAEPLIDPANPILVYQFMGKYVVLFGGHRIDPKAQNFKARLISSPLLKKTRIQELPPEPEAQRPFLPDYDRQFRPRQGMSYHDRSYQGNRPRWGGRDRPPN